MRVRGSMLVGIAAFGAAWSLASLVTAQPGVHADAAAGDDDEQAITLAEAPAAVQAAAQRLTTLTNIRGVSRERDDGVTTYEIEYVDGGATVSVDLSSGGDVLETERGVGAAEMPAAAVAALQHRYPGASVGEAVLVTVSYYEIAATVDGKKVEFKVDAAGNRVGDDDDDVSGDDHDGADDHGDDR